ncbi:hypothetical protein MN116_006763 [Schistosoma mekongi]|uniref:Ubiquitin-like domain-containing protein n=1 Tax=Schistosoma mekongi TaxID=38744 RepID=A0AAE1Z8N8_SCHME|nr:hypothetical protein MN116_006763 [Schistosoma mekongi]
MKEINAHVGESSLISEDKLLGTNTVMPQELSISFTVLHNHTKHHMVFQSSTTIAEVKQSLESLTHVPVDMQKLIFRGILSDSITLGELSLPSKGAKLMLVGTKPSEAEQVRLSEASNHASEKTLDDCGSDVTMDWSDQTEHKLVLERYGKPENAIIGILNTEEILDPDECLLGLCDKRGQPLRLRIKPDSGELWLATKDTTHKFPLATIHDVISQPIKGHPEYHIMAFQLGPTPKSRYFVYWLPSQYVESIKTMVLQYKIITSLSGAIGTSKPL